MKQHNTALKTMAMKARVYNQIRTDLFKKSLDTLTSKQKLELFDKWYTLNSEAHRELNAFKAKRTRKAEIQRLREQRGWKQKVKTPKSMAPKFGEVKSS